MPALPLRALPRALPRARRHRGLDDYAAANRPAGINVTFWMAVGLVLPGLYGLALVVAVVVDAWRSGG